MQSSLFFIPSLCFDSYRPATLKRSISRRTWGPKGAQREEKLAGATQWAVIFLPVSEHRVSCTRHSSAATGPAGLPPPWPSHIQATSVDAMWRVPNTHDLWRRDLLPSDSSTWIQREAGSAWASQQGAGAAGREGAGPSEPWPAVLLLGLRGLEDS